MAERLIEIEAEDEYVAPKSELLDDHGEGPLEAKKASPKMKKKRKLVTTAI